MISRFKKLVTDWYHMRSLLARKCYENTEIKTNLYWFDLQMKYIVSIQGLLFLLWWNLKHFLYKSTNIFSTTYNFDTLYYSKNDKLNGKFISNPSVWNFKGISPKPWYKAEELEFKHVIEDSFDIFKEDCERLEASYKVQDHPSNQIFTTTGKWKAYRLYDHNGKNKSVETLCANTFKVLEDKLDICKNFGFVAFSKTYPGTVIAPHCGSSNLRIRHHIGIVVPNEPHINIRVGTDTKNWHERQCIAFDDSFEHTSINSSLSERTILMIDLWNHNLDPKIVKVLKNVLFESFGKC